MPGKVKRLPSPIVTKVKQSLKSRIDHETLADVATGAAVPYGWLQQLFYDNIRSPGFERLRRLAKYLGVSLES